MGVRWRGAEDKMGTVDLRSLDGDQIVIHYGGALNSVDAYTFANSLIAFADTARAVSYVLDPGPRIEVRVEALGQGSFRAIIKKIPTGLQKFLKRGAENIFWAYVAFLIIERIHAKPDSTIQITDDQVIITRGEDKIIVPRVVYERTPKLKADPEVQKNIKRTFEVIDGDPAIDNFGITPRATDPEPVVQVPRKEFVHLTARPEIVSTDTGRRERIERARLVILKVWLKVSSNKWSFEWNGVAISAPIKDIEFLESLERREHLLGSGDALDVELRYEQVYDPTIEVYVNDQGTFEVIKVYKVIPRATPLPPFVQ
jgi:hypothetical protein